MSSFGQVMQPSTAADNVRTNSVQRATLMRTAHCERRLCRCVNQRHLIVTADLAVDALDTCNTICRQLLKRACVTKQKSMIGVWTGDVCSLTMPEIHRGTLH